jgi:cyclophilin family peptidyl-prolyl cis-trans isomerase
MRVAVLIILSALLALPARAIEFNLYTTNIVMPAGRTFQMPITTTNAFPGPVSFSIVSISKKKLTGQFAPASNPSLLMNVSGVDSNNVPFNGDLVLQLYADLTPMTVGRIVTLVTNNFYNGLTFHRVVQDFIAQGGDPLGTGFGGSGVKFDDEFVATLTFTGFGQLAMANSGPDTDDSQFFITDVDLTVTNNLTATNSSAPSPQWLDFVHTIFGQLTRGFDTMSQIMETPVATDSYGNAKPIVPVVINSASIIDDMQDTVLRLAADASFTGTVSVTVRAVASDQSSAEQTFTVTVVPNYNNAPPFLGSIPASLTVTQRVGGGFPVTVTDLENNALEFSLIDADTLAVPSNLHIAYIPTAHYQGNIWLYPDTSLDGTQNLVLSVEDGYHFIQTPDSQKFALTILPVDTTPTMNIVPRSGTIKVVPNISGSTTNKYNDSINISGDLVFLANSDKTFGLYDSLLLSIGSSNNLFAVTLYPDFNGWRVHKGTVTWKSPSGGKPPAYISNVWGGKIAVSVKLDSTHGKFKIMVKNFDFPSEVLTNQIQVGITLGNDMGANFQTWKEKKPGVFVVP